MDWGTYTSLGAMQRGETNMSARVAQLRNAGVKAAKTTLLEMLVLSQLERQYLELRERLIGKRAEVMEKLQKMGYGPADDPLVDWSIPQDVRTWLVENQRQVDLKELIMHLQAELTPLPPAHGPIPQELKEGLLDATDHQMTMPSLGIAPAAAARLSTHVAQLADAGVKVAKTTMYEMSILKQLEGENAALQEQVDSKRAGMVKLHIMGYGPEDLSLEDQNIPQDVREWLMAHKKQTDLKERLERLKADLIDQSQITLPWHVRIEQKQHVDVRELINSLAAELINQPQPDALLPDRLQPSPHCICYETTLRSRKGVMRKDDSDIDGTCGRLDIKGRA